MEIDLVNSVLGGFRNAPGDVRKKEVSAEEGGRGGNIFLWESGRECRTERSALPLLQLLLLSEVRRFAI